MESLGSFTEAFLPFLALAAMLAALVLAINRLGRHFERHDIWLAQLELRIENLHKDRKRTWARRLQVKATELAPLVPPPLPPRAPTLDASDWSDDDSKTEDLMTRQTGRYPGGDPPKGPDDDDGKR